MSQKFKVSFWIRKGRVNSKGEVPIVVRVSLHDERMDFHSSYSVTEKQWDSKKSRVKGKHVNAEIINTSLDTKPYCFSSSSTSS